MNVIVTDFGNVHLSPLTLAYLDSLGDWKEVMSNKRRRGKLARYIRSRVAAVEAAAMTCAAIAWHSDVPFKQL